MQFVEQIQEFISSVPKPVIFAVVILVLVGGFFLWKKMSKDNETEVEKGALASSVYAQNVASGLDAEREPMLSTASKDFVKEAETTAKDVVGAVAPEESDGDSEFEEF